MTKLLILLLAIFSIIFTTITNSQGKFIPGPVFQKFGKHAKVALTEPLDENLHFKVAFDVSERSGEKVLNRRFNSLARFINMHVANGVPLKNIELALVVHGKAGADLLNNEAYQRRYNQANPNTELINALLANRVQIFLCGQSAAFDNIANQDLIDNVQMALSAMTANALLSQQGFTHNPF